MPHHITYVHYYADNIQLRFYCHISEFTVAIARLLDCIRAIDDWLRSNRLKMNSDKTRVIWLGTRQQLASINITPLTLHDGTVITPSTCVHNLGIFFNSEMSMAERVTCITRCCFYQLRQLRSIQRSLTQDNAKMFVHTFTSRRIGCCYALLFCATDQAI